MANDRGDLGVNAVERYHARSPDACTPFSADEISAAISSKGSIMHSVLKSVVLIAALLGQLAVAGDGPKTKSDTDWAIEAPTSSAEEVTWRVTVEGLAGGACAVGGGLLGALVGYGAGGVGSAAFGMLGGIATGALLGTTLGGSLIGGQGNIG